MASVKSTVNSMAANVERMATRVNTPVNVWTVLATVATLVFGFSQYVDLRMAPVQSRVEMIMKAELETMKELSNRAAVIARDEVRIDGVTEQFKHLDEQHHVSQDRIAELEKHNAANDAKLKLLGDYVKTMDEKGSRKWAQER